MQTRKLISTAAGIVSLGLAALACYGTLAAIAILSLLGIALAVNEGAVAGWAVFFAVLTAAVIGLGIRKSGSPMPVVPAAAGAALVAYAMFGTYDWRIELIGFVLLAAAVGWDFRLRERAGQIPR